MRITSSQKPPAKSGSILLASGLPTSKPTSFSRQLSLLGKTFAERGWSVFFIVKMAAHKHNEHLAGVDSGKADSITYIKLRSFSNEALSPVLADINPAACILLGYPDQFPFIFNRRFVDALRFPVYLWSQFSKPQEPSSLGYAQIVPLTWMTMMYLVGSGVPQSLLAGPVIPHGTDTSIFTPASLSEKHRIRVEILGDTNLDFVIGSVGANSTRKRFDKLIEGFSALYRNNENIKLVIKTDREAAPQGFDLGRLCTAFEVRAGVEIITEEFDIHMLARLYKVFDLYIQVSEWEGFCIPVVEAMSSGLPVSSTPIQGPAEIIPYSDLLLEKCEVVFEGNTVLRWAPADKITKMAEFAIANPARLRLLSVQGREESVYRFDIHTVAERWESLI
jgi:glycosyltransferase involved in cell wall biosynthesis